MPDRHAWTHVDSALRTHSPGASVTGNQDVFTARGPGKPTPDGKRGITVTTSGTRRHQDDKVAGPGGAWRRWMGTGQEGDSGQGSRNRAAGGGPDGACRDGGDCWP